MPRPGELMTWAWGEEGGESGGSWRETGACWRKGSDD